MIDSRVDKSAQWSQLSVFLPVIGLSLLILTWASAFAFAADDTVVTAFDQKVHDGAYDLSVETFGPAEPRIILLQHPYRLAFDLDRAVAALETPEVPENALVSAMRQGLVDRDRYRLLLDLKKPVVPTLARQNRNGRVRWTVSLAPSDETTYLSAAGAALLKPGSDASKTEPRRPFVIVLDPGHGGIDRGALGRGGTEEKALNLSFATVLKAELESLPNVRVVLTRDDDTFIPLSERAAIGRREDAQLFISLHADSIRYPDLRGATVYTLSDKASDALSREVADSENASDRFTGVGWEQDAPEIHDILVDLVRRETTSFSEQFASVLVKALRSSEIGLINNPKRSAGFRVLKAPDVPSVLLEIGYLSNAEEEKLLNTEAWQQKTASAIKSAIERFVDIHPRFSRRASDR